MGGRKPAAAAAAAAAAASTPIVAAAKGTKKQGWPQWVAVQPPTATLFVAAAKET